MRKNLKKTIKEALIQLEREDVIEIKRKPRQQSNTVAKGAQIIFKGV